MSELWSPSSSNNASAPPESFSGSPSFGRTDGAGSMISASSTTSTSNRCSTSSAASFVSAASASAASSSRAELARQVPEVSLDDLLSDIPGLQEACISGLQQDALAALD